MAIPRHALALMAPYIRGKVLSLGYPDLEVSSQDIEKLFGYTPERFTEAHKWHHKKNPFPDSVEFFEKLGCELTIVDFVQDQGIEKVADLNHPQELGRFDLVIDPGTLEHCFNVGQALMTASGSVKTGGVILHLNPMTMLNHGFYNFNPTLMHDFYTQNGWELLDLSTIVNAPAKPEMTKRFLMHPEYLVRTMAKRLSDEPLKFPIQTKYLNKMAAK
jgi:hypothetical protein